MGIGKEINQLGANSGDVARAFGGSFKGAWDQAGSLLKGAPAASKGTVAMEQVGKVSRGVGSGLLKGATLPIWGPIWLVGKTVGEGFKFTAKASLKIAELPLTLGGKAVNKGVSGLAGFYRKAPLIALPVTAVAGAIGISHAMTGGARARSERELQAQAASIGQMPQTYMNSVSADEAAAMEARMKQGGQASFADAAQQQQAAQAAR